MTKFQAKKVAFKDNEGNYVVPVIDPNDKGGLNMIDKTSGTDVTSTLTSIKMHSKSSWTSDSTVPPSEIACVPFTGVYEDYTSSQAVTADTDVVFIKDGVFRTNTSTVATITMILSPTNVTLYDTSVSVRAGQHFKSTVAGNFYYYEGQ